MKYCKLFKFLFRSSSTSKEEENNDKVSLQKKSNDYIGLDPDKIEFLIEKHQCKEDYEGTLSLQEELLMKLIEKEMRIEEFTEDEKIFYENPEWDWLKSTYEGMGSFIDENLRARSLAIKELINNHYQVIPEENGNKFKELINFTLEYFNYCFADKPIDAEKLLRNSFPIMHPYIYRQISNEQNTITANVKFDDPEAYDEFLFFVKNVFCSKYPDKSIRDEQIRRQFKILNNDLILFIEEEKKKE